jgi:LacI family transcriptional regulator
MAVTLKQIAKHVGVSHQAVSYALNNKPGQVSDATRKKVLDAAERLGYRPHTAARAMRDQKTRQVGILVPNSPGDRFTHPLAYETILGVNEGLQKAGYIAVLTRIDDIQADLAEQSRVFEEHALDGMIVLDSMPEDVEQRLESHIGDVVWCDSDVWRPTGCVRRDEHAAGRLAANAVLDAGYRQVLMMTYPKPHRVHYSAAHRFEGVSDVLAQAGVKLQILSEPPVGATAAQRARVAARLKSDRAIICNSIYQANTLRDIANTNGLIPGRDFGLACCDDQHQLDRLWPGLTRVSFDRYAMGLQAAELLITQLDAGDPAPSIADFCDLIRGDTCRRDAASHS